MPRIAYLANLFPSALEPYVMDEIEQLRSRGTFVVECSVRRPQKALDSHAQAFSRQTLYLFPVRFRLAVQASLTAIRNFSALKSMLQTAARDRREPVRRRLRAMAHTWLGAYFAVLLKDRAVEHIHAHHGYFASWIAMTAARLLGIPFSLTLHGSDLLLHPAYLQEKLQNCNFCLTISEFNRDYILRNYPLTAPQKILVSRTGVAPAREELTRVPHNGSCLVILAVGRLHVVKDHAFLIRACRRLKKAGTEFVCLIAGEGPEKPRLENLIGKFGLQHEVKLLGYVPRNRLACFYAACDVAVLTSRSEGIPLALMEAMSHGRIVVAPEITGISELITHGRTGFLYRPGSQADLVANLQLVATLKGSLGLVRRAAREHVLQSFNRDKNLAAFADAFLARIPAGPENSFHADSVLQQVQL